MHFMVSISILSELEISSIFHSSRTIQAPISGYGQDVAKACINGLHVSLDWTRGLINIALVWAQSSLNNYGHAEEAAEAHVKRQHINLV